MATDAPLLRLELPGGRAATVLVGPASTVLSIEDALVASWDLTGRPYALVRDSGTYRRALGGHLLRKREAREGEPRVRERLSAAAGAPVIEAARQEAAAALECLVGLAAGADSGPGVSQSPRAEGAGNLADGDPDGSPLDTVPDEQRRQAIRRLRAIVAMDEAALARDAARFHEACGPVGILPPDQYLSIVVRVTEGCSWNECSFCSLYRGMRFRVRTPGEVAVHLEALVEYLGESIALRRSVFLGDANALCVGQSRLAPLVEQVARRLPDRPIHAFVDAWSGARRTTAEWRQLARLGLKRVYVGLETGDPGLLGWLGKPGRPDDAVELVAALRDSGLAAGVIVLLGAGGTRHAAAHVSATTETLARMGLRRGDLLYFSEYVEEPGAPYAERAAGVPELQPLDPAGCERQRRAILSGLSPRPEFRIASYDLREFVY